MPRELLAPSIPYDPLEIFTHQWLIPAVHAVGSARLWNRLVVVLLASAGDPDTGRLRGTIQSPILSIGLASDVYCKGV